MTALIPGGSACAAALLEVSSDTSTDPAAGPEELHQLPVLHPQHPMGQETQALLSPCPRARAAGLSLHTALGIQPVHIREFRELLHVPIWSHLSREEEE